ncbi:hypothetical protein PR048_024857 [Dryococelus australis]|uniref:Uncharacterized protein n=1 Tax=Dryococelus australis TaxID=614101 RepID=A0ABQ9GPQ2_9NEOP|nr:hypothetical protein PR048_024857 [Dryococelus australis]
MAPSNENDIFLKMTTIEPRYSYLSSNVEADLDAGLRRPTYQFFMTAPWPLLGRRQCREKALFKVFRRPVFLVLAQSCLGSQFGEGISCRFRQQAWAMAPCKGAFRQAVKSRPGHAIITSRRPAEGIFTKPAERARVASAAIRDSGRAGRREYCTAADKVSQPQYELGFFKIRLAFNTVYNVVGYKTSWLEKAGELLRSPIFLLWVIATKFAWELPARSAGSFAFAFSGRRLAVRRCPRAADACAEARHVCEILGVLKLEGVLWQTHEARSFSETALLSNDWPGISVIRIAAPSRSLHSFEFDTLHTRLAITQSVILTEELLSHPKCTSLVVCSLRGFSKCAANVRDGMLSMEYGYLEQCSGLLPFSHNLEEHSCFIQSRVPGDDSAHHAFPFSKGFVNLHFPPDMQMVANLPSSLAFAGISRNPPPFFFLPLVWRQEGSQAGPFNLPPPHLLTPVHAKQAALFCVPFHDDGSPLPRRRIAFTRAPRKWPFPSQYRAQTALSVCTLGGGQSRRYQLATVSALVIEVHMEWCWSEGARETGHPRENPPISGIVRHDSHMQKSRGDTAWNRSRLVRTVNWPCITHPPAQKLLTQISSNYNTEMWWRPIMDEPHEDDRQMRVITRSSKATAGSTSVTTPFRGRISTFRAARLYSETSSYLPHDNFGKCSACRDLAVTALYMASPCIVYARNFAIGESLQDHHDLRSGPPLWFQLVVSVGFGVRCALEVDSDLAILTHTHTHTPSVYVYTSKGATVDEMLACRPLIIAICVQLTGGAAYVLPQLRILPHNLAFILPAVLLRRQECPAVGAVDSLCLYLPILSHRKRKFQFGTRSNCHTLIIASFNSENMPVIKLLWICGNPDMYSFKNEQSIDVKSGIDPRGIPAPKIYKRGRHTGDTNTHA